MSSRPVPGGGDSSAARKGCVRGPAALLATVSGISCLDSLSHYHPAIVKSFNLDTIG